MHSLRNSSSSAPTTVLQKREQTVESKQLLALGQRNDSIEPKQFVRRMVPWLSYMIDEVAKKKTHKKEAEALCTEASFGWWTAATKTAEQMMGQAEYSLYAETIGKDKEIVEKRKAIRMLRDTLKARRVRGNRVESRHVFERLRMEKAMFLVNVRIQKTQLVFTQSRYNIQEYMKAMLCASTKWQKKGTDEVLLLEAQLCRVMHQMFALEKQEIKVTENAKEMEEYFEKCKGWLSEKESCWKADLATLEGVQSSIVTLLDETLKRQDELINKLMASDEFKDFGECSHVKLQDSALKLEPEKVDGDIGASKCNETTETSVMGVEAPRSSFVVDNLDEGEENDEEHKTAASTVMQVVAKTGERVEVLGTEASTGWWAAVAKTGEDEAEVHRTEATDGWWATVTKTAEQMLDPADSHLYAETIRSDDQIIGQKKALNNLRKTLKAYRLEGNRAETRHKFERQRMWKGVLLVNDRIQQTQLMFTQSRYNVQEYLKAMMSASKKWRKDGTYEELLLETQVCRKMHQLLALEKQKVMVAKNAKDMKHYLMLCKRWLGDNEAFLETNMMTLGATQSSIASLLHATLIRQTGFIKRLKASSEFKDIEFTDVDLSHVKLPYSFKFEVLNQKTKREREDARKLTFEQPEIYVETNDELSVRSSLSDPDAHDRSGEGHGDDADSIFDFGTDTPWSIDEKVFE